MDCRATRPLRVDVEELADALERDRPVLRPRAQHRERRAVPELDRARPDARRLGRRPDRRRRGCVHRSTSRCPGGNRVPCAGVKRDRRAADRPAAGRDDRADARATRRHPPPRRAARRTCGPPRERSTGGLVTGSPRSRPRSPCRRSEPRSRSPSSRAAGCGFVTTAEALEAFPPLYERVRDLRPGMFSRSRALVGDASPGRRPRPPPPGQGPLQLALLELDGEPAGYVIIPHRAGHHRTASPPPR